MKKLFNMKKKMLLSTLIKNYILFTTILIIIIMLTILVAGISLKMVMEEESMPNITPNLLIQKDYEDIDVSHLKIAGGWIEVLNSDGDVEYIKGNKLTDEMSYSMKVLSNLLGFQDNLPYFYQSKSFESKNGEDKILLVIIPHDTIDYKISFQYGLYEVSRNITSVLIFSVIIFVLLFIINIYFYSKWTSRKIQKPLDYITKVIKRMSDGDLEAKMDFEAEYEFSQIKNAFNQMAMRLSQSEKDKKKIEASKNQMFVHIAHDLKTPITTINGFSKALSDGMIKDPEKIEKYLKTIYEKSNRMTKLIEDIFSLSKLENLNNSFSFKRDDLVETVRSVVAEYYEQIENHRMDIDFVSNVDTLLMNINSKEISRVISNLLSNAINYNPPETNIRVQIESHDDFVYIRVCDDGRGIDEDLVDSIFLPFIRGDYTRSSSGGSGLGLAISKKIIENHQGSIRLLLNNYGYKTLFEIRLDCN